MLWRLKFLDRKYGAIAEGFEVTQDTKKLNELKERLYTAVRVSPTWAREFEFVEKVGGF